MINVVYSYRIYNYYINNDDNNNNIYDNYNNYAFYYNVTCYM